ncbi:MAG: MauE/DoxX family redox-associated membrane protein [Planctomycetota bacterium]
MKRPTGNILLLLPLGLLVWASVSKIWYVFAGVVLAFNGNDWLVYFVMPVIELLIAFGLVVVPNRFAIPAFVLFSCFIGYLVGIWHNGEKTCNCFGVETPIQLSMAIDFFALAAIVMCQHFKSEIGSGYRAVAFLSLPMLTSLVGILGLSQLMQFANASPPSLLRSIGLKHLEIGASNHVSTSVTLKNYSNATAKIAKIVPSCGCTKVFPKVATLAPGQSVELDISIDLNKSFALGKNRMSQRFTAVCYDAFSSPLGTIDLVSADVIRHFEIVGGPNEIQWDRHIGPKSVTFELKKLLDKSGIYEIQADGFDLVENDDHRIVLLAHEPKQLREVHQLKVLFTDTDGVSSSVEKEVVFTRKPFEFELDLTTDGSSMAFKLRAVNPSLQATQVSIGEDEIKQSPCTIDASESKTGSDVIKAQTKGLVDYLDVNISLPTFQQTLTVPFLYPEKQVEPLEVLDSDERYVSIEFFGKVFFPVGNSPSLGVRPNQQPMPSETLEAPIHLFLCADTVEQTAWFVARKPLARLDVGGVTDNVFIRYFDKDGVYEFFDERWNFKSDWKNFIKSKDDRAVIIYPFGLETGKRLDEFIGSMVESINRKSATKRVSSGLSPDLLVQQIKLSNGGSLLNIFNRGKVDVATIVDKMDAEGLQWVTSVNFDRQNAFSVYVGAVRCTHGLLASKPHFIPKDIEKPLAVPPIRIGSLIKMDLVWWLGLSVLLGSIWFRFFNRSQMHAEINV